MTNEKIEVVGRIIAIVVMLVVNVLAGYLMGCHFHSFIIGYVTYSSLAGLDSCAIKLSDIRESLKGGR